MRKSLCISLLATGCFLLAACQTDNSPNAGTVSEVVSALGQVKSSVDGLKTAVAQDTTAHANQAKGDADTRQFLSDQIEKASFANSSAPVSSYTMLVHGYLAPAAVVLPPPSADAKTQEIIDLKLALSKAAADQATLKASLDAAAAKAENLKGQNIALAQQVAASDANVTTAVQRADATATQLSGASEQVKIAASQADQARKDRLAAEAAQERVKTARWFMLAGGILLAIGVGLTFIHVPDALAVGGSVGGALLAIGWLISYIETLLQQAWFRYVINGSIGVGALAIIWICYRAWQHRQTTAATSTGFSNLVGAIQEASNKNPALASDLAPFLQQWHITNSGAADSAVLNLINKTATSLNLINPGQTSAATGVVAAAAPQAVAAQAPKV